MSLGGGERVSPFTISIAVTLIIFSVLTSGVLADYNNNSYINEFSGIGFNWEYEESFEESDYANITRPPFLDIHSVFLTDLTPDAEVQWVHNLFGEQWLECKRAGNEWFNGWVFYSLEPERLTEDQIIDNRKEGEVFSRVIYDSGQNLETVIFYYPQFYVNGTGDINLIYDTLEESFENDVITVVAGTNATYRTYDVFALFRIVTSFDSYAGIPFEVNILIKTVFWGLILLLLVKLFVG